MSNLNSISDILVRANRDLYPLEQILNINIAKIYALVQKTSDYVKGITNSLQQVQISTESKDDIIQDYNTMVNRLLSCRAQLKNIAVSLDELESVPYLSPFEKSNSLASSEKSQSPTLDKNPPQDNNMLIENINQKKPSLSKSRPDRKNSKNASEMSKVLKPETETINKVDRKASKQDLEAYKSNFFKEKKLSFGSMGRSASRDYLSLLLTSPRDKEGRPKISSSDFKSNKADRLSKKDSQLFSTTGRSNTTKESPRGVSMNYMNTSPIAPVPEKVSRITKALSTNKGASKGSIKYHNSRSPDHKLFNTTNKNTIQEEYLLERAET